MENLPKNCIAIALLFLSFFIFNNNVDAQVQTPRYITTSSISNGFYEYLPQGYSSGSQTYPLLIFIHGIGELGDGGPDQLPYVLRNGPPMQISTGIFPTSFIVNGQTFRFIVISPQFTVWPTPGSIDSLINYAVANYRVDLSRIYLTGLSMGGGAVWDYSGNSSTTANRIAAIVPIAGASWPAVPRADNIAAGDIAVWATQNIGDPTVPVSYTEDYVANINSAPSPPNPLAKETIFPDSSHDAWTQTYSLSFTENGMNVYQWMLQFKRGGAVILPVTGLSLNLQKKGNNNVLLSWKTFTENNSSGFEIQRSTDGINFTDISFIKSAGIGGNGSIYSYIDASAFAGKNYYRLKMIDNNGNNTFSPVEIIDLDNSVAIKLYPNPTHDIINIASGHIFMNAQVKITDATGRIISQQKLSNNNTISVPIKHLPAGIYSAEIIEGTVNTKLSFYKE